MTYSVSRINPNVSPIFIRTPVLEVVTLTNQLCDRAPTTQTPVLLFSSGDNGSLAEAIEVYPLGANAKTVLRLYGNFSGTTTYKLLKELALPIVAAAPGDDVLAGYPLRFNLFKILFPASNTPATPNDALRVPGGYELRVALGSAIASGVNVALVGGNY